MQAQGNFEWQNDVWMQQKWKEKKNKNKRKDCMEKKSSQFFKMSIQINIPYPQMA